MIKISIFDKSNNLLAANKTPTLFKKLIKTKNIIKIMKNSNIKTNKKKRVKKGSTC